MEAGVIELEGRSDGDGRMQALGYKVGAMLTDSHSESSSTQSSRNVVGSRVIGADDVSITATDGRQREQSHGTAATIVGNNVSLSADNAVTLQSARSTSDYT